VKTRIFFVIISIFIFSQICLAQFYAKLKNISAGETHTLALADNNSLWACGKGPLGIGNDAYEPATPVFQQVRGPNGVGNLHNIIAFDAGWVHLVVPDITGCGCCSYENNVALCIVNTV
jgi:hypothetical protein